MVMTRHEFLVKLHEILRPRIYMETGVQYGESLKLAEGAEQAIGIDPEPHVGANYRPNQIIFNRPSREFFNGIKPERTLDLGFIDGSHLIEDVLADFNGMARLAHRRTVIVFDDVLPYNQEIASRTMPAGGDWTGDAWKIIPILRGALLMDGIEMQMVNTFPTGLFVVWNLPRTAHTTGWSLVKLELDYEDLVAQWIEHETVPSWIIDRSRSAEAEDVLESIRMDLCD